MNCAFRLAAFFLALCGGLAHAATPGLDTRSSLNPYLNGTLPTTSMGVFKPTLTETGVFADLATMTPHAGLVPYTNTSPLFTDGAEKIRYIGLPYGGTTGNPTITFAPTGKWAFPNGTVFVKTFVLVVDEINQVKRRMETRFLVRDANGGVYGRTYRWNTQQTEATLMTNTGSNNPVFENGIVVTKADGSTRTVNWTFPSTGQCLECHNNALSSSSLGTGMVLGLRTRQLNGDVTYPSTGRTDNQLHTWSHLGMFNQVLPDQTSYPQYDKLVKVTDTTAPLEHRVRSYLDANCSHCHRGAGSRNSAYNANFDVPILQQDIAGNMLLRHNIAQSPLAIRDQLPPSDRDAMPPLGRSIIDTDAIAAFTAWVNYPYDVGSAHTLGDRTKVRIKFNSAVEAASAATASNYAINNGITVVSAAVGDDPSVVILTTSAMTPAVTYAVTINRVKEAGGVQNPIWPNTTRSFVFTGRLDFNADAKPDLIWSNTANGNTYLWTMNGPTLIADTFIAGIDPSWKVQGVADFNGDGQQDLVWRNTANGNTYIWYMNGATFVSDVAVFSLPPEWVIQGLDDFNADGKPDFLMRNVNSGNAFIWYFNNNVAIGDQFLFNIAPEWKVEGVGDLNADGQPDLFFRNTVSGLAFTWFTQYVGGTLSLQGSTPPLFSIDPMWEIVQVADWNGDRQPDLLFRNTNTGVVFVWYMNGTTLTTSDYITQIDPSWEIVPRR